MFEGARLGWGPRARLGWGPRASIHRVPRARIHRGPGARLCRNWRTVMTCRLALVCSLSLASIGVAVAATGPELNAAIAGTLVADSSSIGPATLHRADWALSAPPPTVMEKTFMPEGWDPHEFSSPARYFWPNPSKPGGLPWIVRDGEPNLEAIAKSDEPRLARMVGDVVALVDAWSATGAEKYASRAELYLRAWFLDPATRMKPDFRGAQFIPGKNRGRGTGLIDMATFHRLLDAVAQLDRWPGRDVVERRDFAAWCREYLAWLDSDRGLRQSRELRTTMAPGSPCNAHPSSYFWERMPRLAPSSLNRQSGSRPGSSPRMASSPSNQPGPTESRTHFTILRHGRPWPNSVSAAAPSSTKPRCVGLPPGSPPLSPIPRHGPSHRRTGCQRTPMPLWPFGCQRGPQPPSVWPTMRREIRFRGWRSSSCCRRPDVFVRRRSGPRPGRRPRPRLGYRLRPPRPSLWL